MGGPHANRSAARAAPRTARTLGRDAVVEHDRALGHAGHEHLGQHLGLGQLWCFDVDIVCGGGRGKPRVVARIDQLGEHLRPLI